MNNFRFILEPYKGMKSRYTCPSCNQRKEFSRYIDRKTGEHLPDQYGKCNRSDNCSYHLDPYTDGYSKMIWEQERGEFKASRKVESPQARPKEPQVKPASFIEPEPFKQSLKGYEQNNFVKYLIELFGNDIANELISRYFIGTSKHWKGANIFWQIDISGRIRTGKIMLYNPDTGKRIKEPFNHIAWAHKAVIQPEFNLNQCFFGEHLLQGNTKPVAIVESEKTATIASVYFPEFIWIAAGNKEGLNFEKCKILIGRDVILYPDLSKPKEGKPTTFEVWSNKTKEFSNIAYFTVNELLEKKADEAQRKEGCDLADYLINFDFKYFIEPEIIQPEKIKQFEPETFIPDPAIWEPLPLPPKQENFYEPQGNVSISWSQELFELENYFSAIHLPARPVRLNQCSTILNVSLFLETHFETLKANNGNNTFLPYLNRLKEFKHYIVNNNKIQSHGI